MRRRNKRIDRWMRAFDAGKATAEDLYRDAWPFQGRTRVAARQLDQVFSRLERAVLRGSEEDRYAAAYALANWHERRAVKALLRLLERAEDPARVRGQAAEGIGDLLGPHASRWRSPAIARLRETLRDPSPEVRFWSARGLGMMEATEAREELAAVARDDAGVCPHMWAVKEEAADALEYMATGIWPERDA